ncbi:hypothetical protein PENTCL1PPCAC_5703 [Pristionchus entomophagus]|uniref:Transthyretin-like family protein n=1 Tax=Pristionchus entomophagus TaxID=358040 RepID=A0AAV5SN48_9BILA|nr:hypothetical protein PENTCL1PPCAC_5703 [Pristionchus entomophagus]
MCGNETLAGAEIQLIKISGGKAVQSRAMTNKNGYFKIVKTVSVFWLPSLNVTIIHSCNSTLIDRNGKKCKRMSSYAIPSEYIATRFSSHKIFKMGKKNMEWIQKGEISCLRDSAAFDFSYYLLLTFSLIFSCSF